MNQQQVFKRTCYSHNHTDVVYSMKREHFEWFEDFGEVDQEVD